MTARVECPICMDDVQQTVNCVTTECGHCFHASCLMRNVAHNGFGCPYCRSVMAEVPEDDEDSEWSEVTDEEEGMFDDFALRGFRFFMNNLEGEEHDNEDIQEEEEDAEEENQPEPDVPVVKPSPAFITQKLIEQGVTMEELVKALLKDHDEYDAEEDEFLDIDDRLFGRLRIIISNYSPEVQQQVQQQQLQQQSAQQQSVQQQSVQQQSVQQQSLQQQSAEEHVDYSAQPKRYANVTVRRQMLDI